MDKIFTSIHNIFAKFIKNEKLMDIIRKVISKEVFSYLFFGVMTTVVNLVVFFTSDKLLGNGSIADFTVFSNVFKITFEDVSTLIAWIIAVLFAYITNKLWVFESKSTKASVIVRELISFFGARIVSFVVFESLGFMFVRNIFINYNILGEEASKWIAKLLMAIVVVIFNYIMSKLVIFKKKTKSTEGE